MAPNMQKIKLLKLYELLRKETDEAHPISRIELCRLLNRMGISGNVRTLSLDIVIDSFVYAAIGGWSWLQPSSTSSAHDCDY